MSTLEIRLFGEPVFSFDGKPWRFAPPPRALPLLVYLALHPGMPVGRTRLAALLWPDDAEETARANLRRHLHQLQRALPPCEPGWICAQGSSVWWNPEACARIDAVEFERLAQDERSQAAAVALYRGDLAEPLYDEWLIAERERLRALQLDLLHGLGIRARDSRDFAAAAAYAEQMLALDEWREDALRLLMTVRYESGDRSAALAAYDRFATRLREQLRVEPMPDTQALRTAIEANLQLSTHAADIDEEPAAEPAHAEHRLPLVGRDEELERLRSAWSRAARGFGTTVFVSGEAGIGKSRLAFELSTMVRAQGGRVLAGSVSDPEGEPYQPVLSALRKGIAYCMNANVPATWLSALANLLPEIQGVYDGIPDAGVLEPERAERRLFEAIARVFEAISRQKPVLLVLEDLHWAGEPTLDLLAFLARRLGSFPLLIVATYRTGTGAESPQLLAVRRKLAQEHRAASISPGHLSQDDLAQLVQAAGITYGAPQELAANVASLSGGNALFATQLLYGYAETNVLPDRTTALETIGAAIASRFARLEGRTRAIAQAAASVGEAFTSDFIAAIGGWPEYEVLDAFDTLIDKGMIREAGAAALEYVFSHALIAQALYESVPQKGRTMRHRRIAALLERRAESERQNQSAIARHWMLAGELVRAQAAHQRAAESALAVYARADAERHARAALELAQGDDQRFHSLLLLGKAQMRSANVTRWRADIDDLVATARRLGDTHRHYEALKVREAFEMQTGDRASQRATIDQMLALSREETMRAQRVQALDALGNLERLMGRLPESIALHREALDIAGDTVERAVVSAIRRHIVQSLSRLGEIDAVAEQVQAHRALLSGGATPSERLDLLASEVSLLLALDDEQAVRDKGHQLLEAAQAIGDLALEGQAHLIIAHYFRDGKEARDHYEAARRLGEQIGERLLYLTAVLNFGSTEAELGNVDHALELAAIALPIARELQAPAQSCFALVTLSEANRLKGDVDAALAYAREAVSAILEGNDKRAAASAHLALGLALFENGEVREGVAAMERAAELRREAQGPLALAEALAHLCVAYVELGEIDRAAELAAELLTCVEGNGLRRSSPLFCSALARVAQARGDRSEAFKWTARGQTAIAQRLQEFDEASAAGYVRLPHVRALMERAASIPETRKVLRNS